MGKINLKKIFFICKKIPKGMISTYGRLAKAAGYPNAVRAIGNVLKKSSCMPKVPCHRVVRSDGFVGGYKFGTKLKIKLLKKEGIKIKKNKILNFEKFLYKKF